MTPDLSYVYEGEGEINSANLTQGTSKKKYNLYTYRRCVYKPCTPIERSSNNIPLYLVPGPTRGIKVSASRSQPPGPSGGLHVILHH